MSSGLYVLFGLAIGLLAGGAVVWLWGMRRGRDASPYHEDRLRETFKALSVDALRDAQTEFVRLSKETFAQFQESAKGDLSQRQQAIATLLKPLEEQLNTYQKRLHDSSASQSAALGEVNKHLQLLAQ